jgi:hypothetical protein
MDIQKENQWIPLSEYSHKYHISISTLRRYIKEDRLAHQLEEGKYFLKDSPPPKKRRGRKSQYTKDLSLTRRTKEESVEEHLRRENKALREELTELRMYVKLLEDKIKA